jgi:hypothetical protein
MSSYISMRAKERGIPMIDANKPIIVDVTPADCAKSTAKNSKECAFAHAVVRVYKKQGVIATYFFRTTAWLEYDDKLVRYSLPPSAQKEIVAFDRGGGFAPGKYQLSKVCKSNTHAEIQKRSKKRRGRHQPGNGKIKRRYVHRTEGVRNIIDPDA